MPQYIELNHISVDKIINAGITKEDAIKLRNLNWGIDYDSDYLKCFV